MTASHRPFGAHMSVAGGVSKAPQRAFNVTAKYIQIFTKNNNRWKGKPLTEGEIATFNENKKKLGINVFASHDCYLINLASPDKELMEKSR
ncbi:Endonuclease IV, partial [hydrothermal vent metagenome]